MSKTKISRYQSNKNDATADYNADADDDDDDDDDTMSLLVSLKEVSDSDNLQKVNKKSLK